MTDVPIETPPPVEEAPAEPVESEAPQDGPAIMSSDVDADTPAGLPEGTVVTSPTGERERIVHTIEELLDEAGAAVGHKTRWHKEPVAAEEAPA